MTKWWNYKTFDPNRIFKYLIVISDILVGTFLDVLFLLLAVLLSGLLEKPRRNKDWVTEKNTLKNMCEGHHFFWLHVLLYMSLFIAFFVFSLPLSKWHTCWMVPIKIHSVWWYHEWTAKNMKISKISCNLILAGWNIYEHDIFLASL